MTDPQPAATRKTNGAVIAIGLLVVAGFVLILSQSPHEASTAVDAGRDAEGALVFDLQEDPHFKAGVPLRPMDRDIFAWIQNDRLTREQMQDLFPDRPYLVRLMGNLDQRLFAVVTIDMNRDGKVDERWELRPTVSRTVPHDPNADDGPVKYTLAHGRWQLH